MASDIEVGDDGIAMLGFQSLNRASMASDGAY